MACADSRSPNSPVRVRCARSADARALAEFNCQLAQETEDTRLSFEMVLRGVRAVLENPQRGFYLVAEADEKQTNSPNSPIASLLITSEWSDWRNAEFWWIQSVYVRREWRRRGLYRALYQYARKLAAQHQTPVCGFRLYVEQRNSAAQKTYAALGMRETGYKMFEQTYSVAPAFSQ